MRKTTTTEKYDRKGRLTERIVVAEDDELGINFSPYIPPYFSVPPSAPWYTPPPTITCINTELPDGAYIISTGVQ
jgi:hypothetical protein